MLNRYGTSLMRLLPQRSRSAPPGPSVMQPCRLSTAVRTRGCCEQTPPQPQYGDEARCMPYVADRAPRIPTLRVLPTAAACSALNNASSAAPTCGLYSFTPQGAAAAGAGSCELHTQSASGRDFAPTLNGMVGCGPYQPRPPRSVPARADFTRRSCSARKAVFLLGASVSRRASGAARTVRRALESGRKRRRK